MQRTENEGVLLIKGQHGSLELKVNMFVLTYKPYVTLLSAGPGHPCLFYQQIYLNMGRKAMKGKKFIYPEYVQTSFLVITF